MKTELDPKNFGLSAANKIEQIAKNHLALVINRKSRIIMKDGKIILSKADKIKQHLPQTKLSLKTTAPICSKTVKFLIQHEIGIISI